LITRSNFHVTQKPAHPLLERLRLRFSPNRARLGADGPQLLTQGRRAATVYLVGRELCLFLRVDAAKVPSRQRRQYVELAVRRAAPFPDPVIELAWQGSHALAWYWSRSRVSELLPAVSSKDRFRAEPAFIGGVSGTDAQLLTLPAGCEGRLWRDGYLVASRWWPTLPDDASWTVFTRGAGMDPGTTPHPAPEAAVLGSQAWTLGTSAGKPADWLTPHLPRLAMGLVALVLFAFSWQIGNGLRSLAGLSAANDRAAVLERELEPILQAREAAEAAKSEADTLLALRPPVPTLMLMAEASRLMQGSNGRVDLWAQPNPEIVEVRFTAQGMNSEAIVAAWEESPYFSEVTPTLSPQGDGMTLRAGVTVPAPEPAP
jgi:hypothetical protein